MRGKISRQNIASRQLSLDRGNPLIKGLVACVMLSQGGGSVVQELARGRKGTLSAGAWITTSKGIGRDYRSPTGLISFAPAYSEYDIAGDMTIEAMIDGFTVPVFGPPGVLSIFSKSGAGVGFDLQIYYDGAGAYYFGFSVNTSAGTKAFRSSTGFFSPATGRYHLVVRFNKSNLNALGQYYSLFVNGTLTPITYRTGSDGNQALVPATLDVLTLAGLNAAPYNNINTIIYWGRLWNRALSDSDILSLYKKPFSMFAVPSRTKTSISKPKTPATSKKSQYKIKVFDSNYNKVAEMTNESGQRFLNSFDFELLTTGCGAFKMTLVAVPDFNIARNDILEVYFMNQPDPFYVGFVQSVPEDGRTDKSFSYTGYGFIAKFDDVVVSKTYAATELSAIATDLLESYIIPVAEVIENPAKITATGITAAALVLDYAKVKKAVFDLGQLADGYLTGVDEFREFFFIPIDDAIQLSAVKAVEKHLTEFTPKEDISRIANKLYIKSGANVDGSNYALTVQDVASQAAYGLKEDVITAPTLTDNVDVGLYAARTLAQRKDPLITASVKNINIMDLAEKIIARGKARILLRVEK